MMWYFERVEFILMPMAYIFKMLKADVDICKNHVRVLVVLAAIFPGTRNVTYAVKS